jgi:hypothetical protein
MFGRAAFERGIRKKRGGGWTHQIKGMRRRCREIFFTEGNIEYT